MSSTKSETVSVRVLFGPKRADSEGRLVRLLPGRLVVESSTRHPLHTTLHLELELEDGPVRARGVVERVVPLGPWADRRGPLADSPVALTILVISDCPALDALAARMASSHAERRRYPRFEAALWVSLGPSSALGSIRTGNVSRGGLYVESPSTPAPGDMLSVRLHLPDGGPSVRGAGRVVHVLDDARASLLGVAPGIGLALDDLLPQDAAHLEAWLDRLRTPED